MKAQAPSRTAVLQDKVFVLLLVVVSAAFAWIVWPFFGVIFWAAVLGIMFGPLYQRLLKATAQRRSLAALITLVITVIVVILPAVAVTSLLMQEGFAVYARVKSGELDVGALLQRGVEAMPAWATGLLQRFGLTDFASVQERFSAGLTKMLQVVGLSAVSFGQNAFEAVVAFFLMLYVLFFVLRDGDAIARRIETAVPLDRTLQRTLSAKFANVVRATIKGTIVVAIIQGALGGSIFWLLGLSAPVFWGAVMAFLSLLPAVGTALVWAPVALYFLATGAVWQGVVLIAFGVFVIGLVDNVVRPVLVGKDTKMPDYVVLIATLGGMATFGLSGFVIGPLIAAMFMAVWDVVAKAERDVPT
jgi:predicted PurR-regulated permease PerM